jgi:hypothetical protein
VGIFVLVFGAAIGIGAAILKVVSDTKQGK